MKLHRPLSSPPKPEQPTPPPAVHRASGQSILGGGRGSSTSAQGCKSPPGPQDDHFHHRDGGARPCASGSSVRGGGGGHSGNVSCSFVPPDGSASGKTQPKPFEKLAEKLRDLFKRLFGDAPVAHSPGRVATGDSSRTSGSSHSGSGQGRIGVEEELQAGASTARSAR
ncbi:hypothetical protein JYK02_36060 [Corallococcus macrosporus]|uniref:Uncharacterized protein n=1 Tax=Corallococcus macrosporus TaxID=35 RepID=A0ABS3DNQ5_9BACT|nr:hypothetical protein [Corallococcus macrosporus]MBN8232942.1 hypothetical protein [Corallococcus macrosporus]